MKLEERVVGHDLSHRLKELGVEQTLKHGDFAYCDCCDNLHAIREDNDTSWLLGDDYQHDVTDKEIVWTKAHTVAELGEMLPGHFGMDWFLRFWKTDLSGPAIYSINYKDPKTEGEPEIGWMWQTIIEPKEADARAKMLIHLIEKGLVKP